MRRFKTMSRAARFLLCVDNKDYSASLKRRKVYQVLALDRKAPRADGHLVVVLDSLNFPTQAKSAWVGHPPLTHSNACPPNYPTQAKPA